MKNPDMPSNEQQHVDDPRPQSQEAAVAAPQKARASTPFVDPYDMRVEPQPEEPGYGHGV